MSSSRQVTLVLDSSGPVLRVGVGCGTESWSARQSGIKQEQFLLPLVQRVLAKAGAHLPDVRRIFFVKGPGRFTGIRISLTLASMLQQLNNTQVGSATVFEILYRQVLGCAAYRRWKKLHPSGVCAIVLHAFREEYFLQFFGETVSQPQWLSKEDLIGQLKKCPASLYIAGRDREGSSLKELLNGPYMFAPAAVNQVRMDTLLQLADQPVYQKEALEPLYLKPARFELEK